MSRIYNDITETIGNTPLVRLHRTAEKHGALAAILLKLEFFNPLSSVKDRVGVAMIDEGLKTGAIDQSTVLIEAASGNAGIALAFVAAARGLRLILTMPETTGIEQRQLLKTLGAQVVLTDGAKGMKGAIAKAIEIYDEIPDSFILHQFSNSANPEIHRRTTAEEIWRDTGGTVDFVIAGIGTGGTITGVAEVVKKRRPGLKAIAVETAESPIPFGSKPSPHKLPGNAMGLILDNLNLNIVDEIITVKKEDSGLVSKEINRLDGIPAGISGGAIVWAALQVAKRPENEGKTIVAIIPSASERCLSSSLFADMDVSGDPIEFGAPEPEHTPAHELILT